MKEDRSSMRDFSYIYPVFFQASLLIQMERALGPSHMWLVVYILSEVKFTRALVHGISCATMTDPLWMSLVHRMFSLMVNILTYETKLREIISQMLSSPFCFRSLEGIKEPLEQK